MIGTLRKLQRFFTPGSQRSVLVSLDHGVAEGMVPGADVPAMLELLAGNPVQGVVLNKGPARAHASAVEAEMNLIIQLSAGTRHGLPTYNKSVVCSVGEALRLGADAVAVQLNIGNDLEDRMLADCGLVTDEAHQMGLPVLAVVYARGGQIINEHDPALIAHCIRLGGELGFDMVCTPFSGDAKTFAPAVESCPMPVLVAGGPPAADFDAFLEQMDVALKCGASGVNVGRTLFQHPEPGAALERIQDLVHG
jgi:class I fructose-bisphosphate aldolase